MPPRAKRIRYTFADASLRQARSAIQPVYAWKKAWSTPAAAAAAAAAVSADEPAFTLPYKLFKWSKTGETLVHEDEDDEVPPSQLMHSAVPAQQVSQGEHTPLPENAFSADTDSPLTAASTVPCANLKEDPDAHESAEPSAESAIDAAAAALEDVAAATCSAHAIANIAAAADSALSPRSPLRDDNMSVDDDASLSAPATEQDNSSNAHVSIIDNLQD